MFPHLGYYEQHCYEHRGALCLSEFKFCLDICPGLGLLDHMATVFLGFGFVLAHIFFKNLFLIGVELLYNAVLVSAVQQCESVQVYIYLHPLEPPSHPYF